MPYTYIGRTWEAVMDWYLNFKLWETQNAHSKLHLTKQQRIARVRGAVVSRTITRGCMVLAVNFGATNGTQHQRLPSPVEAEAP